MKMTKLMLGDNIQSLRKLPDNSIDSVVTDPPYGLSFMGKKWDYDVPSIDFWKEVWRVLKPGGHVLSFGGTRTYHRMVVNIEDAGFEIRDQVMWLYGSGFPKSHNIGKSVDKIEGNERVGGEVKSRTTAGNSYTNTQTRIDVKPSKGQSKYEGWGSSLKPANEPICVARKPLSEKTIAENVIKWGTGGINIDGCRISTTDTYNYKNGPQGNSFSVGKEPDGKRTEPVEMNSEGRFPANIILDETAAELLDEQSGLSVTKANKNYKWDNTDCDGNTFQSRGTYTPRDDKGGASRYFYVAKVSKKERNLGLDLVEVSKNVRPQGEAFGNGSAITDVVKGKGNTHPTLKPINLMTYLCRLVTPEGGIVLDAFMGSGSTGIAALLEGFRFIGMEQDEEYFKIATARIEAYEEYRKLLK